MLLNHIVRLFLSRLGPSAPCCCLTSFSILLCPILLVPHDLHVYHIVSYHCTIFLCTFAYVLYVFWVLHVGHHCILDPVFLGLSSGLSSTNVRGQRDCSLILVIEIVVFLVHIVLIILFVDRKSDFHCVIVTCCHCLSSSSKGPLPGLVPVFYYPPPSS